MIILLLWEQLFLFAVLFVVVILIVDILYGIIDPRIRLSGGKK